MVTRIVLGILTVLLLGILGIACGTSQAAENTPSAQSAVSASAAHAIVQAPAQQTSAKQSSQVERPVPPAFQGRTAPSAAFPFSDEEYIAAGKRVLQERSDISGVRGLWQSIGNPSRANLVPLGVGEICSGGTQNVPCYIGIMYQMETNGGTKSVLALVTFKPGVALEVLGAG